MIAKLIMLQQINIVYLNNFEKLAIQKFVQKGKKIRDSIATVNVINL